VKLFTSCARRMPPAVLNVPDVKLLINRLYELSTSAAVILFVPTRQSFESYFHTIVWRPSAFAIARMRSYDKGVDIAIFRQMKDTICTSTSP